MKTPENFNEYKIRCSSLGNILTNPPDVGIKTILRIEELEKRKLDFQNGVDKVKPLTENMKIELNGLILKRDAPDELPTGAKSYLDTLFRAEFWKRKRLLDNKYLHKGTYTELDSIRLLGIFDDEFYSKNKDYFSNDFIAGTPDIVTDIIIDIKSNWDLDTFDNVELTTLYEWQIKAYCWLTGKTKGVLAYCLVNAPDTLINNELERLFYSNGSPEQGEETPEYIEKLQQIERNLMFDVERFKEEFPYYEFKNTDLDFTIPKELRVKKFDVVLRDTDIEFMETRVALAREYLNNKVKEVKAKIKSKSKANEIV